MTVTGPMDPGELGLTLTHEHLHIDATSAGTAGSSAGGRRLDWSSVAEARWNPLAFPDNLRFTNTDLTIAEIGPFRAAGGDAIVDVTPASLGRSPAALVEISRRAGIRVVMGGGFYTQPFHPAELATQSPSEIAETFIREIRSGADGTGIRPGIQGEVGTGDPVTPGELKVLRAHAIACRETDVPITIHQQSWAKHGHTILDAILAEGAGADRVVMGHMTPVVDDDRYQRSLLDRGAFLGYDFLGIDHSIFAYGRVPPDPPGRYPPSDYEVIRKIAELVDAGYADQILLSGDTGELVRMKAYGGWGFAHIPEHLIPLMGALGLSEASIHGLLVQNPRRLLTVRPPA